MQVVRSTTVYYMVSRQVKLQYTCYSAVYLFNVKITESSTCGTRGNSV